MFSLCAPGKWLKYIIRILLFLSSSLGNATSARVLHLNQIFAVFFFFVLIAVCGSLSCRISQPENQKGVHKSPHHIFLFQRRSWGLESRYWILLEFIVCLVIGTNGVDRQGDLYWAMKFEDKEMFHSLIREKIWEATDRKVSQRKRFRGRRGDLWIKSHLRSVRVSLDLWSLCGRSWIRYI